MELRQATLTDAPALLEIYNHQVDNTVHTFDLVPRTLVEQQSYIQERSGALRLLVAETPEGEVAGYAGLSFYRDRAGYRTTVEDSIYIHPDHQRQGVGHLLLADLIEQARLNGFHSMMARIVGRQEASTNLHAKLGFELVGVEREIGRKFGRWLDVAIYQLMLTETTTASPSTDTPKNGR